MPAIPRTYQSYVEDCGCHEQPGLAVDGDPGVDYSKQKTTVDQRRIEQELEQLPLTGSQILHVGVGNSRLAQKFHSCIALIDGVTIHCTGQKNQNIGYN